MNEFEILLQAVEDGIRVQTITLIGAPATQSGQLGQMLLVFPTGEIVGSMIDTKFTQMVVAEIKKQVSRVGCVLKFSYQQADYQVFWNAVGQEQYQAIILGGGHVSQPLVQILAILGYEITVVDDRPEFANPGRFPGAQRVLCDRFDKVLQDIKPNMQTAVIIITRGHKYDLECLRSVIGTEAGYIGMIGSRRKVRSTLQVLQEEGISQETLGRVRAPIGLDLGGQSPEEIGVSIVAEVIATFKGGSHLPLSLLGKAESHG